MSNADLLSSSPDHLKTYSLTCEPFANDLDGRFFYAGAALTQWLDLLTHLTQFGDAVILVSGPPGSGKTTLLGRFAGQTGKQWKLCLINADEFEQFAQRLSDALGISDTTDEQQIIERWSSQTDASQRLVIVIDNSEQLQAEAFEKLCHLLKLPQADRIRLILFATPEGHQRLKQSFDQKGLACDAKMLEVPRLSEEETASYLMYRLAVAGFSGESPFTATEVRAMCKAAGGRPAEINKLAHEALLEHQIRTRSKRTPRARTNPRHLRLVWGLSSILVIGIAIYVGWLRLEPDTPPAADAETTPPIAEIPIDVAEPAQTDIPQRPIPKPVSEVQPQAPLAQTQAAPDTPQEPVAAALPVIPTEPEEPRPVAGSQPQEAAAKPESPSQAAPAPETPRKVETASSDTGETPASPIITETQAVATPLKPAEKGRAAGDDTPVLSDITGTGVAHDEAWLLRQPENSFSLQLLGTRNATSINNYVNQHRLDHNKSAYYRGIFRGGEWYVLLYGIYPDRQAALAARAELPAKVRKDKPWPRTLKSIHTAINAAP